MKNLIIGNLIAKFPIIQGGMGVGVSLAGLAASVANQGGIGVISLAGVGLFEHDSTTNFVEATKRAIIKQIQKARENSNGILGVNIMTVITDYAEIVKTAIAEKVDIIFAGAGLPLDLPAYLNSDSATKLVPIVSSARTAEIICNKWQNTYNYLPDAIVVEGPEAGGHLGFKPEQIHNEKFALEHLYASVQETVSKFEQKYNKHIPVIVGGGIYSGEDVYKFLKMGAAGVQMGTRFVTTHECDASDEFKQMYINANIEDIGIIQSPVGLPGRAVNNDFLEKVKNGQKHPINCHYHCLKTCDYHTAPYCILHALLNAARGKMNSGFAFCGSSAYKTKEICSVEELFAQLIQEYNEAERKDLAN